MWAQVNIADIRYWLADATTRGSGTRKENWTNHMYPKWTLAKYGLAKFDPFWRHILRCSSYRTLFTDSTAQYVLHDTQNTTFRFTTIVEDCSSMCKSHSNHFNAHHVALHIMTTRYNAWSLLMWPKASSANGRTRSSVSPNIFMTDISLRMLDIALSSWKRSERLRYYDNLELIFPQAPSFCLWKNNGRASNQSDQKPLAKDQRI